LARIDFPHIEMVGALHVKTEDAALSLPQPLGESKKGTVTKMRNGPSLRELWCSAP
jgi:hypothetical protein